MGRAKGGISPGEEGPRVGRMIGGIVGLPFTVGTLVGGGISVGVLEGAGVAGVLGVGA